MFEAVVVVGAVLACFAVIRLLTWQRERAQSRATPWWQADRAFHSTGWEETIPPLEVAEPPIESLRRRAREGLAA